jgi:hypothetical protein
VQVSLAVNLYYMCLDELLRTPTFMRLGEDRSRAFRVLPKAVVEPCWLNLIGLPSQEHAGPRSPQPGRAATHSATY